MRGGRARLEVLPALRRAQGSASGLAALLDGGGSLGFLLVVYAVRWIRFVRGGGGGDGC